MTFFQFLSRMKDNKRRKKKKEKGQQPCCCWGKLTTRFTFTAPDWRRFLLSPTIFWRVPFYFSKDLPFLSSWLVQELVNAHVTTREKKKGSQPIPCPQGSPSQSGDSFLPPTHRLLLLRPIFPFTNESCWSWEKASPWGPFFCFMFGQELFIIFLGR